MTTADDLRRLAEQSRVRLAAVEDLREESRHIVRQSRRRLDEGRRLLARHRATGDV